MKKLVIFLLLNGLFITTAQARNCVQAVNNKHCSSSSGVSALTSQGSTVIGSTGQSPNPAQTNSPLGSGTSTQQAVVQVYPLVPHRIVGQAQAPIKPVMSIPPKATVTVPPLLPNKAPMLVPTQPVMNVPPKATVTVPPLLPNKTPMLVPTQPKMNVPPLAINSKPPLQVYMVPSKVITGNSKVPQKPITTAPPKTFTSPPQQQVQPVPGQVMTGNSKVPQKPITTAPPKTFTSPPQQQVSPVPGQVMTGNSKVPQKPITTAPPKMFISSPQQQVYPIPTPILIGYAAVPVTPVKQTSQTPSQLPYNVPSVVAPPKSNTVPPSQQTLTPVIITHVASSNLHPAILLQQQMLHGSSDLKSLEPHIKGLPVDVYTGKNVHKTTYENSTSINSKGFHLTVLGVKEPTFVDTSPLPVAVKPDDIIFNFSFASAEIHKDQLSRVDKIIEKHSKNGKRIILMGETDGFGSETYNKHLAILRANKIIDELKARGAKVDDVEIRILVRCCRKDHPTKETLADTSEQRITWVHFQ